MCVCVCVCVVAGATMATCDVVIGANSACGPAAPDPIATSRRYQSALDSIKGANRSAPLELTMMRKPITTVLKSEVEMQMGPRKEWTKVSSVGVGVGRGEGRREGGREGGCAEVVVVGGRCMGTAAGARFGPPYSHGLPALPASSHLAHGVSKGEPGAELDPRAQVRDTEAAVARPDHQHARSTRGEAYMLMR